MDKITTKISHYNLVIIDRILPFGVKWHLFGEKDHILGFVVEIFIFIEYNNPIK